jgi:hypothetical protein
VPRHQSGLIDRLFDALLVPLRNVRYVNLERVYALVQVRTDMRDEGCDKRATSHHRGMPRRGKKKGKKEK